MRTKKKTAEQKQKQPEIREISPVDGYGCLWRKRFLEKICKCASFSPLFTVIASSNRKNWFGFGLTVSGQGREGWYSALISTCHFSLSWVNILHCFRRHRVDSVSVTWWNGGINLYVGFESWKFFALKVRGQLICRLPYTQEYTESTRSWVVDFQLKGGVVWWNFYNSQS